MQAQTQLDETARVEDVPLSALMRAVVEILPPSCSATVMLSFGKWQSGSDALCSVAGMALFIDGVQYPKLRTVGAVLGRARREADRIASERLRNEQVTALAYELASMDLD